VDQIPDLIDNERHRLGDVLKGLLANSPDLRLDVATAFFNLRGLEALEPEIERLRALRLLLGQEQEQAFVLGERLLAELEDAAARGEIIAREIRRWRDFLARDSVAVRRYRKAFLHGKAYIVDGLPVLGAVGIVGSSNFTGAGLTINRELNAVLKQASAVRELQSWFEALWQEAEDYKAELLELLERFTRTYTPYEIYIKAIYEALRDRLDQELGERDARPSPIALTDFQRDGYLAAREILESYGGVLIADSVGLGKTYLALRLLDDYAYGERQTALIVCPAAIRETVWRPLLQRFSIPYELVSMEEVSRRDFPVDEYARRFRVIVVDESHNFRNPGANRWENLFRVIARGDPDKKVILLTATPVNNTVFDLYHQLRLITRDDRGFLRAAGIPDLWDYFRRAEENKEALYEVLEALAVRRSRPFIRRNYPEAEIDGQRIRFPERKLHTVRYSLKDTYGPDLYRRIASTIEGLLLAPYQVELYRKALVEARRRARPIPLFEAPDEGEEGMTRRLQEALGWSPEEARGFLMAVGRQTALAHILRVLYLKRLESSAEALRISLRRLQRFLERFLQALEAGRLLKAEDYRRWLRMEGADEEGLEEEGGWEALLASLPALPADRYDLASLRAAVQADLRSLEGILRELERDRPDDKLEALKRLLASRELRGRKIVVFSYFKDTARYLHRRLSGDPALAGRRLDIVDSDVRSEERTERIRRFAPRANGRPDLPPEEQIDILISTDVLSEGQNLQDADVAIHYDLHWNPVRMVQRVGRLDRLGSPHAVIHVYNFFPEEELEELLGLLRRLREKLDAINRTVGLDASILGETPNPMDFNILRRLEREDPEALQELEEESELTVGEFLKQDLLRFLKAAGEERLRRIPLGVGTARRRREGPRGFFAAFRNPRTSQHHWLFYDEERDRILERRLEAIRPIRCEPSEPPAPLPEEFDPRPFIEKLRRHLWNRIRRAALEAIELPAPQRQIVNWLRALPPSAERNRLLAYFEARPLSGPDLQALRRLWRERSTQPPEEWLKRLVDFMESHPHPPSAPGEAPGDSAPEREEDLECIVWMRVL
jgi:superfamily II DNA or RNA helicase